MAIDSTKPTWLEPPPKQGGMGCVGKGCLFGALAGVLIVLLLVLGTYLASRAVVSPKPAPIPEKPLSEQEMTQLHDRIDQFKTTTPVPAPMPTPLTSVAPSGDQSRSAASSASDGTVRTAPDRASMMTTCRVPRVDQFALSSGPRNAGDALARWPPSTTDAASNRPSGDQVNEEPRRAPRVTCRSRS